MKVGTFHDSLPDWARRLLAAPDPPASDRILSPNPKDAAPRSGAVLILIGEGQEGPDVLLIERSAESRDHPAQVAFPGGSTEPDDRDAVATALREAAEETGIDPAGVRVLRVLPARWLSVSRFEVVPVLAWWVQPTAVRPGDLTEVAAVARVPLALLANPAHRRRLRHPRGGVGPAFDLRPVGGFFIWGFTASLLDWLLDAGGWARPWDDAEVGELPLPRR
ncbi:MAG: CoA pyrophosphatase [Acidothermus sp.]|nr:CoA pyrophosphatase [Acidothermus sp.]